MSNEMGQPPSDVSSLSNEEEFQTFLSTNDKVVVKFFATWCAPCRRMVKYYENASNVFTSVKFAKIDVTDSEEMALAHGIEYYPTFICYKEGKEIKKVFGAKFEQLRDAIKNLSEM